VGLTNGAVLLQTLEEFLNSLFHGCRHRVLTDPSQARFQVLFELGSIRASSALRQMVFYRASFPSAHLFVNVDEQVLKSLSTSNVPC
jgi:hypothetical protein